MARLTDIVGSVLSRFQFGIGGPLLKRDGANQIIHARNAADNAFADMVAAALTASGINVTGESIVINSDAAGSGDDWSLTLSRAATGMTEDVELIFPAGLPTVNQALTVADVTGGVITFGYTTIAAGTDKMVWDTTALAFGTSSPVAMFNLPANAVVMAVKVVIDTAFDGTPQLSVGVSGTTSKYLGTGSVDLTATAGTVFEVDPGLAANGSGESLIATYTAGSATAGAARILVGYVIPS